MDVLRRIGLQGPYQVHIAPTELVPDERAHQVFEGFGATISKVAQNLARRYSWSTPATILRGNLRANHTLQEVAHGEWLKEDVLVIPAMRSDHAGGLYGLAWVVDRLLGPGGCPWDQEQTHESLKRHLIEEAYELVDAIDSGDEAKLQEELGDVLLQPMMHSQMEKAAGSWDIEAVAMCITNKLVRRHPHVFGDVEVEDSDEVLRNWDKIKASEGAEENSNVTKSILDGVPRSLPSLLRAFEVSKRAARNGFEWQDLDGVWEKFHEETEELQAAVKAQEGVGEEVGDLLFTVVNIARWVGVEPEDALRRMVDRFSRRFRDMECTTSKPLSSLSFDEWDDLWTAAKTREETV